jgi:hypothetical protein
MVPLLDASGYALFETKPFRFDIQIWHAGSRVNRNDTVSFYLQADQICICWDAAAAIRRAQAMGNRHQNE